MLRELHVRNLAVLARASIPFGAGFNVLSGETGAGKSIVVDSLALLAGGRASSDLIRTGTDTLTVTGVFEPVGEGWREVLAEAGLEAEGDELLIRREIQRNGRNRIFVDDQPATARLLGDLAPYLLRIHGQREELGLVETDLQRAWLDRSGGAEARELLERVGAAHDRWAAVQERLERLEGDARARAERLELLRFQAAEIDRAAPVAGEDVELRSERDLLRNAEAIIHALATSVEVLFDEEGSASERLARSEDLLADLEASYGEAEAWRAEAEELRIRLEELARTLQSRLDDVEVDPARLDAVEDRLARLESLGRKYVPGEESLAEALVAYRARIGEEIEDLEGEAEGREALEAQVAEALDAFATVARELSARRAAWGQELTRRVHAEIAELGLDKASLEVRLEARARRDSPLVLPDVLDGRPLDFHREGIDQVVFLFSPNPGEEPQPLARIASGGELSRVSLGLQLATRGERAAAPTLIFDEVDTGIGGAQAAALGKKLGRLAASGQILAVTHLPQVASFGHRHFRVVKTVEEGRTETRIVPLEGDGRVEEIARMLAGETITDTSLANAREMIARAREAVPAVAAADTDATDASDAADDAEEAG